MRTAMWWAKVPGARSCCVLGVLALLASFAPGKAAAMQVRFGITGTFDDNATFAGFFTIDPGTCLPIGIEQCAPRITAFDVVTTTAFPPVVPQPFPGTKYISSGLNTALLSGFGIGFSLNEPFPSVDQALALTIEASLISLPGTTEFIPVPGPIHGGMEGIIHCPGCGTLESRNVVSGQVFYAPIPEPGSLLLVLAGVAALVARRPDNFSL